MKRETVTESGPAAFAFCWRIDLSLIGKAPQLSSHTNFSHVYCVKSSCCRGSACCCPLLYGLEYSQHQAETRTEDFLREHLSCKLQVGTYVVQKRNGFQVRRDWTTVDSVLCDPSTKKHHSSGGVVCLAAESSCADCNISRRRLDWEQAAVGGGSPVSGAKLQYATSTHLKRSNFLRDGRPGLVFLRGDDRR